jgi:hypothetical protein
MNIIVPTIGPVTVPTPPRITIRTTFAAIRIIRKILGLTYVK